ncbi:MAG: efflux transporter outer membrane subunit, partial [Giesbergeria sp.]
PGGSPANSQALGVAASWEVDLWGRVAGTVDAAEASFEASSADLASARLSLQALLAQSYFALRAAEAQQQLLSAVLAAYDQSRTLTRNRVQAGVAPPSDADQAEAQYQSTRAQWFDAQATRAQWEHALAALVGEAPANFALEASAVLPAAPTVPLALPAELLQRRPDIAAAQRRVAAANAQLGVAQTAFFPALTLSASAGFRSSSLASLISAPNLVWSLGPQLALALFDNGARTAAREAALANVDLAAATYRGTVITALQEVEDALSTGASLQQQTQAQQLAVAAAQRALTVAQNQYRAGTVGYLNVLSAQASLLAGQRSLIELQRQQLVAVNTLLKNLGGGWAEPPSVD